MCLCDDAAASSPTSLLARSPAWPGHRAGTQGYNLPHLGPGRGCRPISRLPSCGNQRQWWRWVRGPFASIPTLRPQPFLLYFQPTRHHCVQIAFGLSAHHIMMCTSLPGDSSCLHTRGRSRHTHACSTYTQPTFPHADRLHPDAGQQCLFILREFILDSRRPGWHGEERARKAWRELSAEVRPHARSQCTGCGVPGASTVAGPERPHTPPPQPWPERPHHKHGLADFCARAQVADSPATFWEIRHLFGSLRCAGHA